MMYPSDSFQVSLLLAGFFPPFICRASPSGSDSKESACSAGDPALILRLGRSPGEGNGNPLQYSCLGNPWTEEPARLQSMGGHKESDPTE